MKTQIPKDVKVLVKSDMPARTFNALVIVPLEWISKYAVKVHATAVT